jgi:5-methylcytosine-specific restriction endonuclease McrA|tara:strand:- start:78 stop:626 length:549 start_codon:yes stop_codon:yes gene_type:complete
VIGFLVLKTTISNTKTLKLDSSYRPLEIVEATEALVLCLIGKAYAIENYTQEIRSISETFKLPAVIVLTRYVKFKFKTMTCKRNNIIWRDNNQCQYCTKSFESGSLTIDHIVPKSKGGKDNWLNLVAACKKCNQRKGSKTPSQAGMKLIREPVRPKISVLQTIGKKEISNLWTNYLWDNRDD